MKTAFLLVLVILSFQASKAGDFTKEQNAVALQIEALVDYEGEITVFSLNPMLKHGSGLFHGYEILASAELRDRAEREALLKALSTSIRESNGDLFLCFSPRHGLRFSKGGKTSDIVICFQCESSSTHGFPFKGFLQTSSAQVVFDKILGDIDAKQEGEQKPNKAEMATPRKPSD